MKEYKIGEEITLVVKEEPKSCMGCFYFKSPMSNICWKLCTDCYRSDHKNVIFVEKGK